MVVILLQVTFSAAYSQWKIENKISVFLEEGLYSNWASSGFNFLSTGLFYSGKWNYASADTSIQFQNNAEIELGTMYQEQTGWKKTSDKILANSSFNKRASGNLNYNGTFNFRSTFDPFLSPTILLAIGGTYLTPNWNFQFNPITERVNFYTSQHTVSEFGSYMKVTYKGDVMKNVSLAGRLEWFYEYGGKIWKESFWNMELRFDGKINEWLGASIIIEELFDTKQSHKLQSRERIGLNFTYKL